MRRLRKLGVNTVSSNTEKTDESANQTRIDETSINNNCSSFVAANTAAADETNEIKKDDNKNTIISGKIIIKIYSYKRKQQF